MHHPTDRIAHNTTIVTPVVEHWLEQELAQHILFTVIWHQTYGKGRKEGNVLFNDALNTFYLRLYEVGHMVKDHSDSERENPLLPHTLLFPISSKGSFICIIPQTGYTSCGALAGT